MRWQEAIDKSPISVARRTTRRGIVERYLDGAGYLLSRGKFLEMKPRDLEGHSDWEPVLEDGNDGP